MKSAKRAKIVFAVVLFGLVPCTALADDILTVTVNTSSLPATPGSEIVFVLTDGSGVGDANNTATLSGFVLGGGNAGAVRSTSCSTGRPFSRKFDHWQSAQAQNGSEHRTLCEYSPQDSLANRRSRGCSTQYAASWRPSQF